MLLSLLFLLFIFPGHPNNSLAIDRAQYNKYISEMRFGSLT